MASEEQVVQKFPHLCPYCDRPISYDQFALKRGENRIQCPSCRKTYIKMIGEASREGTNRAKRLPGQHPYSRNRLLTPVQYVKGVGPRLAQLLEKKGIRTVEDGLYVLPRGYED